MSLFEEILISRGLMADKRQAFLHPDYSGLHDPFLLPDMGKAVKRLVQARKKQQHITIYGDYDIDGLTATSVLLNSLRSFGFNNVEAFIPNRFVEGYGLTSDAVSRIAKSGAEVLITVDCGSLSEKEITLANELGVDVIVTDHHNVAPIQPPAVAVINPKRLLADYPNEYDDYVLKNDSKYNGKLYPFLDLAGVGVAFKLVQALQTKLDGFVAGQEKWLLDLVALGTVCDVVKLTDENRTFVFWGLKVLEKTRREGLRALLLVSGVNTANVNARSLGFSLGPRMNASGRLETAQHSLDLLMSDNAVDALRLAQKLDVFNTSRKSSQQTIFREAVAQAEQYMHDEVLVVSSENWNHGIVGIVAAKLMEKYSKPVFVLEETGDDAKGSARSYGDFSVAGAIRAADDIIQKGGGHKYAAGVTLPTRNIGAFRERVNQYYRTQNLFNQQDVLLAREDAITVLNNITEDLVNDINTLEPFGSGNRRPVLKSINLRVAEARSMGTEGQHIKLRLIDERGKKLQVLAFNAPEHFFMEVGSLVDVWYHLDINEWNGRRSVEGYLLRVEVST